MHDEKTRRILASAEFQALHRTRGRLVWTLTGLMITLYLGFGLAAVYFPDWLARPLSAGSAVPIGVPLAYSIVLAAIVLAGYYVHRTNTDFEPRMRRLRKDRAESAGPES